MLYTFVLHYRGTIATRQAKGDDLKVATESWIDNCLQGDSPLMFGANGQEKELLNVNQLKEEMKSAPLVPLKGLTNAWSTIARLDGGFAILNVIQTHTGDQQPEHSERAELMV